MRRPRVTPFWLLALALVAGMPLASAAQPAGEKGVVRGQVFDRESGDPVADVTVLLISPERAGAADGATEVVVTDAEGAYAFPPVAAGLYELRFTRDGFRASTISGVEVVAGQTAQTDFPLPRLVEGEGEGVLELDAFVVEQETVEDAELGLEMRLESDEMINTFGAEDFSRFSAGDVAEALERVAGVTIQEGQFAVIRGLEDRYNSTLYNGAPVPSPDPDRQSVQLDLFPKEVVGNLVVSKTFAPDLPSNSSGGAIDIVTHSYPEEWTFTLKAGTGINTNAEDRFLRFSKDTDKDRIFKGVDPMADLDYLREEFGFKLISGNPVGIEDDKTGDLWDDLDDVLESDYVVTLGGRQEFGGREFRFKGVLHSEIDYSTLEGYQQSLEPRPPRFGADSREPAPENFPRCIFDPDLDCFRIIPGGLLSSGDLSIGELNLNNGTYDLTTSQRERRRTAFAAFGFDLDEAGNHKIDSSVFYTQNEQRTVRLKENGFIAGLDYDTIVGQQLDNNFDNEFPESSPECFNAATRDSQICRNFRQAAVSVPATGALAFTNFFESTSFERDRDLFVFQVNGDHVFEELPDFHLSWATNYAETTQEEVALGMPFYYEPCGFGNFVGLQCPNGVHPVDATSFYPAGPASEGPPSIAALGPGSFISYRDLTLSSNLIEEKSRFTRIDADYTFYFSPASTFTVSGGWWSERADRDVRSAFLQSVTQDVNLSEQCAGSVQQPFCFADTPFELGELAFNTLGLNAEGLIANLRLTENESTRDIDAWHARGKFTFWDRLDILGGVRVEDIFIESLNDPFIEDGITGGFRLGGPETFPSRYLFFDRLDNPKIQSVTLPNGGVSNTTEVADYPVEGTEFNDQLIGILTQPGPCTGGEPFPGFEDDPAATCVDFFDRAGLERLVNGRIDETRVLPSASFSLRPTCLDPRDGAFPELLCAIFEGLTLRGAYSETVARPSFREMGFYVSVEPGSSDLTVGNPQLQLSDVESWDARGEYTFGRDGGLLAFSYFRKRIEKPIESIILRDPSNLSDVNALFRTFFNNPDTADLKGWEAEARIPLTFLTGDFPGGPAWWPDFEGPDWFRYLSVGGNYTKIDALVRRTETELKRSEGFFAVKEGDEELFTELAPKRRLFNQPKWIANVDVTFNHPDWGTSLTVAYFAISNRLVAAGSSVIEPNGDILSATLDRYVDGYEELRATFAQEIRLPNDFGTVTLRLTGKNLTDSKRKVIYDPSQLAKEYPERVFKLGRDFEASLTYTKTF